LEALLFKASIKLSGRKTFFPLWSSENVTKFWRKPLLVFYWMTLKQTSFLPFIFLKSWCRTDSCFNVLILFKIFICHSVKMQPSLALVLYWFMLANSKRKMFEKKELLEKHFWCSFEEKIWTNVNFLWHIYSEKASAEWYIFRTKK